MTGSGAGDAVDGDAGAAGFDRTALAALRLAGHVLAVCGELAGAAGLTAARWQVIGAVAGAPQTAAGIARTLGITRQSVRRTADLLVADGLATWEPNPAHRRARLLTPTALGRAAIGRTAPHRAAYAHRLAAELGGGERLADAARALERLTAAVERAAARPATRMRRTPPPPPLYPQWGKQN
ncbi:MarR family winged helix-turn-helix transcriptional regulator [Streptomyces sp. RFCAC02]|uniref:MarR family winged helix-turn-helix transcriptional regulator n=1 Tax=Streptomyces sp. RFCAC02 TaxID=2499143 RepID=UPI001F0F8EA5|nr:MarR family winged helix-turn-helix transcriptional regulator [Streptomyces sp. RFCAC02]